MSCLTAGKDDLGPANLLLEYISKHFVSLNAHDVKKYGEEFRMVLDMIIERMKEKNKKFNECCQRTFYAGSYWDGLKVERPTEFDVDIVIKLPFAPSKIKIECCENPAFVKVKMNSVHPQPKKQKRKMASLLNKIPKEKSAGQHVNKNIYGKMLLKSLLDFRGYFIQKKLRTWMESVLYQALDTYKKNGDSWLLYDEIRARRPYMVKAKKSGPALTLNVTLPDGFVMDIDLVAVIEFKCPSLWAPCQPKLQHYIKKHQAWFIVPKPNKWQPNAENQWRMAFHEQERDIFATFGAGVMKPVCRLLKKLRDNLGLSLLSSYCLKTLVIWEISKHRSDIQFFHNTMAWLFIHMLMVLRYQLKLGKIAYFWDKNYNLLEDYDQKAVRDCYNRINRIVNKIEYNVVTDPLVLAEYVLNAKEFDELPDYLID